MRITTNILYNTAGKYISEGYGRISTLQQEVSTGIKLTQGSIDPVGIGVVTRIQAKLQSMNQINKETNLAHTELSLEQTQVNVYGKVLQKVATLINKAANSTNNSTDLKSYANELRVLLGEVISIANTKNQDQKSIFSGTKENTKAYDVTKDAEGKITGVTYEGDENQQGIHLSSNTSINIYQSGNKIFGEGENSVFKNLIDMADRLETGKPLSSTETSDQMKKFEAFRLGNVDSSSRLKSDVDKVDFEKNMNESFSANYKQLLSTIRDADYTKTVTELSKQMTFLQAAMSASTQVEKLSIFQAGG